MNLEKFFIFQPLQCSHYFYLLEPGCLDYCGQLFLACKHWNDCSLERVKFGNQGFNVHGREEWTIIYKRNCYGIESTISRRILGDKKPITKIKKIKEVPICWNSK